MSYMTFGIFWKILKMNYIRGVQLDVTDKTPNYDLRIQLKVLRITDRWSKNPVNYNLLHIILWLTDIKIVPSQYF